MTKDSGCKLCRVMVVDDDATNLVLAQEVIRFFGAEPVTHTSGTAALPEILRGDVDMVLMDVHMPGLSGLEVTQQVRAWEAKERRQHMPIIALTASAMPQELTACLEHGMDDAMTKPFVFDVLRQMLKRWCPPPKCS